MAIIVCELHSVIDVIQPMCTSRYLYSVCMQVSVVRHSSLIYSWFCVKGRLKEHVGFWREELEAPEAVLSVIESGYVLPLKSMPDPSVQKNQLSAEVHADFVQDCIEELLASKCVKLSEDRLYICSPLSVV